MYAVLTSTPTPRACVRSGKQKKEADERLEQSTSEVRQHLRPVRRSVAVSVKIRAMLRAHEGCLAPAQVEAARKERSVLEQAAAEATAKLTDLDAQRGTLIKTHAKDLQTWQTQLRAAQAAEKDARTVADKAAARVEALEAKPKSDAVTGE